MYLWTSLVTILAVCVYAWSGARVAQARRLHHVKAPATTGDPAFERAFRAQQNTLEWMPIFLPLLWLFAFHVGDVWAALIGLVWVGGRVVYVQGYARAAEARSQGFAIQALACAALLGGDVIALLWRLFAR